MKLILTIKDKNQLTLQFKEGSKVIDKEDLTISQNLDTLLISTIDKLTIRNSIDRLSLKDLEIQGKMRPGASSTMIIGAVKRALKF